MSYSSSFMNKYWIPSQDIHKKVITQELQYHLGPQATVRPYTREGEDGFLITTPGPCLSDVSLANPRSENQQSREKPLTFGVQEQIDDICQKSREMWELKAAARATEPLPQRPLKRPLHQPVVIAKGGYTSQHRR